MQDLMCNVFESFSTVFDQSPRTVESNLSPDVGTASIGMVRVNVLGKSAYGSEST